jgi:hypothetical protein
MDLDGGGYPMELQARQVMENATLYKYSSPCPQCGVILNPIEFMMSKKGLCPECLNNHMSQRAKGKMA